VENDRDTIAGIRGWLFVFVRVLTVWEPLRFAWLASTTLSALNVRGPSLAVVLIVRLMVTAFGVAAGVALKSRHPSAPLLARTSVVISAAMDLFIYLTSYVPNNRMPGDTPIYIAVSLTFWSIWLVYLFRSRRVRNTYE
jgi:hypothetical protein